MSTFYSLVMVHCFLKSVYGKTTVLIHDPNFDRALSKLDRTLLKLDTVFRKKQMRKIHLHTAAKK